MRVFHFLTLEHGLDDLRKRRLKIATINELNDPFELLAINLADPELRRAFRDLKDQMAVNRGVLCFSRRWHNPVQWSHYADKHRGLCLGFEVPDKSLQIVDYAAKRLVLDTERLLKENAFDEETAKKFLFTKYSHWRYESEVRAFLTLDERDPETKLFFADFSPETLRLSDVFVGAVSSLSRAELHDALGDLSAQVSVMKTRLAFKTFRVVRQRDPALWI